MTQNHKLLWIATDTLAHQIDALERSLGASAPEVAPTESVRGSASVNMILRRMGHIGCWLDRILRSHEASRMSSVEIVSQLKGANAKITERLTRWKARSQLEAELGLPWRGLETESALVEALHVWIDTLSRFVRHDGIAVWMEENCLTQRVTRTLRSVGQWVDAVALLENLQEA